MDDWDEEKLDEVIKKKHGSEKSNATDIVSYIIFIRYILGGENMKRFASTPNKCLKYFYFPSCFQICKYFLEAVENSKYGWFWTCPAGADQCKYRHALPAGYVLKKVR